MEIKYILYSRWYFTLQGVGDAVGFYQEALTGAEVDKIVIAIDSFQDPDGNEADDAISDMIDIEIKACMQGIYGIGQPFTLLKSCG